MTILRTVGKHKLYSLIGVGCYADTRSRWMAGICASHESLLCIKRQSNPLFGSIVGILRVCYGINSEKNVMHTIFHCSLEIEATQPCVLIGFYCTCYVRIFIYWNGISSYIHPHEHHGYYFAGIECSCLVMHDNRAEIPWWWCSGWSLAPLWYRLGMSSYVPKNIYVLEGSI